MNKLSQSVLGPIFGALFMLGLIGGASVALADRVTTVSGTVSSVGLSSSGGSLTIGGTPVTTTGTLTAVLNLAHANSWTALQSFANSSSTLATANRLDVGASATTTITTAGQIGIGSTTPTYDLTLASGKSVGAVENTVSTSTSYVIDATKGPSQLYRTGSAATTFTATGFLPGVKVDFTVCNPPATSAGAITWSGFHTFGTAPSQTTTANQCDKYVVGNTAATSSANGIMYYAQAGAGLQ